MTSRPALFDGLPLPADGRLTLYLLGPGYGEGQVLIFPDGKSLVVDCCHQDGESLSAALLDYLGITTIDLLVLTHPDLDHLGGLRDLVARTDVKLLWRFKAASRVTDLAAYWLRTSPDDDRLRRLYEELTAVDELEDSIDAIEACYGYKPWRGEDYEIHCVAPTQHDLVTLSRRLRSLVSMGPHSPRLSPRVGSFLLSTRHSLGETGNVLSLALSIKWKNIRLLLAGDVENGDGTSRSGWRGILRELQNAGELELLTTLAAVKLAHHGSSGAFLSEAWERHSFGKKVEVALITPYNRGQNPPPHSSVLLALRKHAEGLI